VCNDASKTEEIIVNPHVDLTSITLLMQNEVDGLEVLSTSGEWIPAPKIQDCILVNTGKKDNII
jgi:isopenicillin N synthase-like dioxygenase